MTTEAKKEGPKINPAPAPRLLSEPEKARQELNALVLEKGNYERWDSGDEIYLEGHYTFGDLDKLAAWLKKWHKA